MHQQFSSLTPPVLHRKGPRPRPLADRFWEKVNQDGPIPEHCPELGPCWVWTAKLGWGGYGAFFIDGTYHAAHRVSWVLAYGSIPDDLLCLHKCDWRSCIRPDHLFLGSDADNAADRDAKGRTRSPGPMNPPRGDGHWSRLRPEQRARGSGHGRSKLREEQVVEIRRRGANGEEHLAIAQDYGVTRATVSLILERRTWRHL